jgi:flagellar basal-body rod protein FlgB
MNEVFKKIESLSQMASYYLERTKVIQSNIANADTPGFKPKELVFKTFLQKETIPLKKENPRHIEPTFNDGVGRNLVEIKTYKGYDENEVDVHKELAKLTESSIMYKTLVENIKKEFSKLKTVISGGR